MTSRNKIMVDLYFVKSPRQWWMAHGLGYQLKRPFIMVVNEGFKGAEILDQINNELKSEFLVDSILIPGKLTGQHKGIIKAFIERKTQWSRAKKILQILVQTFDVCRVITANLNVIPIQFLHDRLPNTEFHIIDDGLETYQIKKTKYKGKLSNVYASIFAGFKVCSPNKNEILPFYTQGWFIDPKTVDSRFKKLIKKEYVNVDVFKEKVMIDIARKTTVCFQLDFEMWHKPKIVFVLSRSDFLFNSFKHFNINTFIEKIQSLLSEEKLESKDIWVKYHPREMNSDDFKLESLYPNINVLPSTIPFEILTPTLLNGDIVVGEISTALFDVAQNSKGIEVYSLCCLEKSNVLQNIFKRVGIISFEKLDKN